MPKFLMMKTLRGCTAAGSKYSKTIPAEKQTGKNLYCMVVRLL